MKHYIWLDDLREMENIPSANYNYHAKSYKDFVNYVLNNVKAEDNLIVSFDHDLGEKKSGYDIAKWLIENGFIGEFDIHSMNPVGAFNIRQLLCHYGWNFLAKTA